MEKKYYASLNETVYHEILDNGLNVFLIPKEDYKGVCGVIAAKFGSINSNAVIKYNGKEIRIKRGAAHFLEHRMFDNKKGPVLDLFSALGAFSDAFTTFDKTAYYFSSSQRINECVDLLLDFVDELNISEESVENEKDIIVEELNMYKDNPDRVLFSGLLSCLYKNHEVRNDIGGEEEDVRSTTYDILKAAHTTFYHPNNMVLTLVGNIDVDKILEVINKNQSNKGKIAQNDYYYDIVEEPLEVFEKRKEIHMDVALKKIAIGYKHKPYGEDLSPKNRQKQFYLQSLYLDLVFSSTSEINEKLYNSHVILRPLDARLFSGDGYNASIIMSNTNDEKILVEEIDNALANPKFTKEDFDRVKNTYIAMIYRRMDEIEALAVTCVQNYFDGISYFDDLETLKSITYEEVLQCSELYDLENKSIFVILPNK